VAPIRDADRVASDDDIITALVEKGELSLRDRVDLVAEQLRAPRKKVYDLALRSRKD